MLPTAGSCPSGTVSNTTSHAETEFGSDAQSSSERFNSASNVLKKPRAPNAMKQDRVAVDALRRPSEEVDVRRALGDGNEQGGEEVAAELLQRLYGVLVRWIGDLHSELRVDRLYWADERTQC